MDYPTTEHLALDHGLRETRAQLEAALDDLSPAEAENTTEAAWTIRQTLTHLVAAEPGMLGLCQRILAGKGGARDDFDLTRHNQHEIEKRTHMSLSELLAQLESNRQNTLAYLATLSAADLQQTGRHGSGQMMSIAQIIEIIGRHEASHAREIGLARA